MPFTFSHPAIILPFIYLNRKWISLTGLVVGSISPDFEYFFRMKDTSSFSHSLTGLYSFDLPVSVLLAFTFHNIVRNPLMINSPYPLRARLAQYTHFSWNKYFMGKWIIILLSMLVGILSHFAWDEITHKIIRNVTRVPALSRLDNTDTYDNDVYFLFWIISSIAGLLIVIYAFWRLPVRKGVIIARINIMYWLLIGFIGTCIFFIRASAGTNLSIYDYFVSAITAGMLGLVGASLIFRR